MPSSYSKITCEYSMLLISPFNGFAFSEFLISGMSENSSNTRAIETKVDCKLVRVKPKVFVGL